MSNTYMCQRILSPHFFFLFYYYLHIYRTILFSFPFFYLILEEFLSLRARLSACDQEANAISHNGVDRDFYSRPKSPIKHMILKSHTMHKNPGIILSGCCVMVWPASAISSMEGFVCVKPFLMFEYRPEDSLRESCSPGLWLAVVSNSISIVIFFLLCQRCIAKARKYIIDRWANLKWVPDMNTYMCV